MVITTPKFPCEHFSVPRTDILIIHLQAPDRAHILWHTSSCLPLLRSLSSWLSLQRWATAQPALLHVRWTPPTLDCAPVHAHAVIASGRQAIMLQRHLSSVCATGTCSPPRCAKPNHHMQRHRLPPVTGTHSMCSHSCCACSSVGLVVVKLADVQLHARHWRQRQACHRIAARRAGIG